MENQPSVSEALLRIQELTRMGLLEAAEAACRELVEHAPQAAPAWVLLGLLALQRGELSAAEAALRQAVALHPGDQTSWLHLGNALYTQSRYAEAADAFRQALALNQRDAGAWRNLGTAEQRLERLAEAQTAFERSLALAPGDPTTLSSYALLLSLRGQPQRSLELLRDVLEREPRLAHAHFAAGNAYMVLGDLPPAEAAFRRALELAPQHEAARQNLAIVQELRLRLREAEGSVRQLLANNPQNAEAWAMLGRIQRARIEPLKSLESLRRAVALAPHPERHSMLLVGLQYADDAAPDQLLQAHRQWDAAYARHLLPASPPAAGSRDGARPLRLGFLSADFGRHPAGYMVLPVLECLDKTKCSVVCYSDRVAEDEYTARFRAAAAVWRTTSGMSAGDLAEQIRRDEIDILVDLMGHFGRRLLVFARQPAPLQVTWFGYVGTTGLAAMDFLLTDRFRVRDGEEANYQETVLRMPHDHNCYRAPADAPEVGPLPAGAEGRVTFGSFNNPAKFSARTVGAWASILRRTPQSRLLLKYNGLDDPEVQNRLRGQFAQRGVAAERILLEGRSPHRELLASYNRVDLALDTQPFSGDLTTCEALWMGVPVISFPGKTFAGRHSASHLSNTGYEQFVAADVEGYIELAAEWASRLGDLATIRSQMREQVRQSPLCDAPRFARDLLTVLHQAWDLRSSEAKKR